MLLQAQSEEPIFRSDTRLVVVHATVSDSDGKLVTNLPKSAFRVYENGVPQELKLVRQEDIPVSLGLVLDSSASMREKRQKVASAALALVQASHKEDEVFILNFADEPTLQKDFTSDIKELEKGLRNPEFRGGTAMRDALRMGIEHLKHESKRDKKALLVVTDGDDNSSIETLQHLVQVAQQNEVLIYAVGFLSEGDPRETERARKALDALTQATGGLAYYPQKISEIDGIAQQVAKDIRNQYTLAYTPSNQATDGTFRRILVEVNGPGALKVRARSGYYATPDGSSRMISRRGS